MAFRTSYSQNSMYIQCPKMWHLAYKEKWKPLKEGASLYFGSAIDAAITLMLQDFQNGIPKQSSLYVKKFHDRWEVAFNSGKAIDLFDNDNIAYSYSDFDEHVLEVSDLIKMDAWSIELNLTTLGPTATEIYKEVVRIKKNPYKNTTADQLKFFNRVSWLSLYRKGAILVKSFEEDFLPKVKKVITLQQHAKIEDPSTGDVLAGVIDMVLEVEGYPKPIIFDLKTSAMPYTQAQIEVSEQLTSYAAMKALEYGTDLVGYAVLCKNIPKEFINTCDKCGNIKNSRHKTCDSMVPTRCGGNWVTKKVLKPVVQLLVEKKSQEQILDLLGDVSNIVFAMKSNIIYKNTNRCDDHFGASCPYKKLCWEGNSTGLVKK